MLESLSSGVNKLIERFQDNWEINPAFRTMWSVIGCAIAIVFLCSSLLIGMNVANSFTKGNTTQSGSNNNYGIQGGNLLNPTYAIKQAPPNITTTPGAEPVATSGAATPTPTIPATPDTPTVGPPDLTPSATVDPSLHVTATQSPQTGWSNAAQNQNKITNVTTTPQSETANAQIDFQLDFQCRQVDAQGQLDGNGQISSIQVNIPGCFKSTTPQLINVTVLINNVPIPPSQVTATFYATGQ